MKKNLPAFARAVCMLLAGMFVNLAVNAQSLAFETFNKTNTSTVFTVDAFRSVTVDKRGNIWAGSDLGGLYKYNGTTWTKAATYPDITFKDLLPSNLPGDSSVWAASIGKTGVQAITGGVYHITDGGIIQFGTGTFGGLGSRYANGIVMSNVGVIYTALGFSTTGATTNQGGIYDHDMISDPAPSNTSFTKTIVETGTQDIYYASAGNRDTELWFGRMGACAGTCVAPYIVRLDNLGNPIGNITAANSPLPFTESSASPFARAIYTDTATGNTFVGLSGGAGVGVLKADGTWKLLTNGNSGFPAGAAVNFNAISDVYGEIWIGTTSGIFAYNSAKSLDDPTAFRLYTTADGLPANSVTDITVDLDNIDVWITSASGVSRLKFDAPGITGTVFNVYCTKPDSTLNPVFLQKVMGTGVTVKLFENGTEKESVALDANGNFKLKEGEDGKLYTVEIQYPVSNGNFVYRFNNVAHDSLIGAVMIPDSLISEVKAYYPIMEKKCFPLQLPFGYQIDGFACRDGFIMTGYDEAYKPFNAPLLSTNYKKQVENLANYYASLNTMTSLSGSSMDMMNESFSSCLDAIHSLFAFLQCGTEFGRKKELEILDKEGIAMMTNMLKLAKEGFTSALYKAAAYFATDAEQRKNFETQIGYFNDAADFALQVLGNGVKGATLNTILDVFKKVIAIEGTASTYKLYARNRHEKFISSASISSKNAESTLTYGNVFNQLYNPGTNSLVKYAKDTTDRRKDQVGDLRKVAKVADAAAGYLDALSLIVVIPGGQPIAAIAKGLSTVAKVVQTSALAGSMVVSGIGAIEIADLSSQIIPKAQFSTHRDAIPVYQRIPNSGTPLSVATLTARKNAYNLALTQFRTTFTATYDSAQFFARFKEVNVQDSLYTAEMIKTLNELWASADSAVVLITAFGAKLNKVVDSFVTKQYAVRQSFFFQNMAYIFETNKNIQVADLTTLTNEIIRLNDSAINGIAALSTDIVVKGIVAPAYLVQDGYTLKHDQQPGSKGSFTYSFKNYGTQVQNNVSFKISAPTNGFTLTSADSIFVGTIQGGETKQVTFSFTSPLVDTIGRYQITVKASNGRYNDVTGSLMTNRLIDTTKAYTIKAGKWSEPATWSTNLVPVVTTEVTINHAVTVDINASCKSLQTKAPGKVIVNTGINLRILK